MTPDLTMFEGETDNHMTNEKTGTSQVGAIHMVQKAQVFKICSDFIKWKTL